MLFHAGTAFDNEQLVTAGGRVICVAATSATAKAAIKAAYQGLKSVEFEGSFHRHDIGHKYDTSLSGIVIVFANECIVFVIGSSEAMNDGFRFHFDWIFIVRRGDGAHHDVNNPQ